MSTHPEPARLRPGWVVALTAAFVLALTGVVALGVLVLGGGQTPDRIEYEMTAAAPEQAATVSRVQSSSRSRSRTVVDPAWAARIGGRAGVPAVAMRAYGAVELILRKEQPRCHLSWNTLAGIGWVESQHGTIDGRTLLADGRSSTPVLGPALNGDGFAAIRSTPASQAWHGDATWEHAVGPLQFIPSTWDRWAADGDSDGIKDPLDLDDAALAAGRYLCADRHDLATTSGWNAAIHSYNHDRSYVLSVAEAANSYAHRAAG